MENDFIQNLHNFPSIRLKAYMAQILKERYPKHEQLLERLGHSLTVDADLQSFVELMVDVYETGYLKAFGDYQESFNKLGYNVEIVSETPKNTSNKIFK